MKFKFFEMRDMVFIAALLTLIGAIKAFSVKRKLCALYDGLMLGLVDTEKQFKECLKKFAQYEVKDDHGRTSISTEKMPPDILALFNEELEKWQAHIIHTCESFKIILSESIANNLELSPQAFVLIEKYLAIEIEPDSELDALRSKNKELEESNKKLLTAQDAAKNALKP